MAAGATMSEAAAALNVSRRTCVRRLAAAKVKLGALTTAEAVLRAVRDHGYSPLAGVWVGLQATTDAVDIVDGSVALVCTLPF